MIPSSSWTSFPPVLTSTGQFSNQSCLLPCAPPAGLRLTKPRCEPPRLLPKHLSTTSGLSTCKRLPSPSQNSNTHFSSTRIPLSLNSQSRGSFGHLIAKPLTLFPLFFSVCSLWPVHKFLQVRDHDSHFFWTPEHPAWKQIVIRKNDLVSLKTTSNWN